MRPDASFISQPVRSLQTMLRTLAEHDNRYQSVVPDGIYSSQTANAVAKFQQNHGLPITGITDQRTWEEIVIRYEPALIFVDEAQPVEIILNPNEVLIFGSSSPYLYVAQAMLITLSQVYGSVASPSVSGILDQTTADALSSFQSLIGLPVTGNLDKHTWKHLALHFPLAANFGKGQPQAVGNHIVPRP